jgi:outer membrane lipoprotein-sorting protein
MGTMTFRQLGASWHRRVPLPAVARHDRGRMAAAAVAAALLLVPACAVAQAVQAPIPVVPVTGVKVPLPRLRPGTVPRPAPPAVVAPRPQPAAPQVRISPNSKFTPDEQIALAHITTYFNSFKTLEGSFLQIGPTGEQSEGVFNLSRPGNIRFRYNPPSKLDVIADGRSVAIRDGAARTQDLYPLSRTPLRYLLADKVDLTDEKLVDSVREEPDLISVLIIEKSNFVDGKLALIFDRKTHELRQWIVTDAQGLNTSVVIYNVATDRPQDPKLFYISTTLFQ